MQVLNIFHVLIAISMIAFILVQKGAGATAGAAFGSGASGTVFGSRGAGNFLSRSTWVMAAGFCLISLTMAVIASRMSTSPETDLGVMGSTPVSTELSEPLNTDGAIVAPPVIQESDLPSVDSALSVLDQAADQAASDMPSVDAANDATTLDAVSEDSVEQADENPDAAQPDTSGKNGS